jgi:spermidine/putrescine ABC transporter ATP-binding subunit
LRSSGAERADESRSQAPDDEADPGEGPMTFLELTDIQKRFGDVAAVEDFNLAAERGEFVSFLGPSGCGKTTTLRMIAGFEQPTDGTIVVDGTDITHRPPNRRNVGMVFQSYALFPNMTVARNVGFGMRVKKRSSDVIRKRVGELLELINMPEKADRYPYQLSGGQQQRVALARALVNRPTVLLLDEPLGALDLKLRKEMQLELKALQQEVGITFVYVTHDQEEALTMSDVIVVMQDGRIQQMGNPTELYERPVNQFVSAFIGTSNFLPATVVSVDGATSRVAARTDLGLELRGNVTDPGAAVAAGDHVTIAIRPERLEILPGARDAEPGWSTVAGRIHQGTYLGDQTEFRVHTDLAGELVVRRQNATGAEASLGVGPGDPVSVRWQEEANLVLVA